jgi:ribonuclease-3
VDLSEFDKLQDKLGIVFSDPVLLRQALVHRSYLHENPDFTLPSNERLEFLGDAVLGIVIAEKLYIDCPLCSEGDMTKLRSTLVRRETLARLATSHLNLSGCLYVGRGEESSGGRDKQSILAGAFEAVIGAVFIDQGFEVCRALVLRLYDGEWSLAAERTSSSDFKSQLQEAVQSKYHEIPVYRVVAEEGPDHEKEFTVEVAVGEHAIGRGSGKNKRGAENEAARAALEALGD